MHASWHMCYEKIWSDKNTSVEPAPFIICNDKCRASKGKCKTYDVTYVKKCKHTCREMQEQMLRNANTNICISKVKC